MRNETRGLKLSRNKGTWKHIIVLCGLGLMTSCAFKSTDSENKLSTETSILQANESMDITGDGIPNEAKIALGLNPNIAYFPRLSIYLVKDVSLGAIFKERANFVETDEDYLMLTQQFASGSSDKGGDLDFLKVLRRKMLINQYKFLRNIREEESDTITDEDLKSSILSNWGDEQYYAYRKALSKINNQRDNLSGKLGTNFKIKIKSSKAVSQVSNIKIKSFYYDFKKLNPSEAFSHYLLKDSGAKEIIDLSTSSSEYIPATNYNIFVNDIKKSNVRKNIVDRNEVGLEFEDFDYKVAGVDLNYSKVISSVIDKCAKVVISDGKKTEIFYITPRFNLRDALKLLGKDFVQNKDGTIDSLGEVQTNIPQPIEFDSLRGDDLKKGVWSIFGESDNLDDQLKAKGFYFVSYASMKDLLDASKREVKLSENTTDNQINITRAIWGDELTIKINSLIYRTLSESFSKTAHDPVYSGAGCNFVSDLNSGPQCREIKKGCEDTNSSPTIVNSNVDLGQTKISEILNITDEYGNKIKADVFSFEDTIVVKFNYPMPKAKNKLTISFIKPEDKEYQARSGVVATTCEKGTLNYSYVKWKNNYEFNYSASIFGALKY